MATSPANLRQRIVERAKGFCEYCRSNSQYSESPFDIDHVFPSCYGGKTIWENLTLSCHGCNLYKSNKTSGYDSIENKFKRLFNPRKDIWDDHFLWKDNFTIIMGTTGTGRVTVEVLNLNRSGLIMQRAVLHQFGEHPPDQIS